MHSRKCERKDYMKRIYAIVVLLVFVFLIFEFPAYADNAHYDILQQMFLSINDTTTQSELDDIIAAAQLFSSVRDYNSRDGQYTSYIIAYEESVAKHSRADTGDHLEINFRKSTGTLFYISYFNAYAFYADYNKNYEAQKYYEEGYKHQLGFYGHNSDTSGMGVFKKEVVNYVPFDSAEDALKDVLNNAKAYRKK